MRALPLLRSARVATSATLVPVAWHLLPQLPGGVVLITLVFVLMALAAIALVLIVASLRFRLNQAHAETDFARDMYRKLKDSEPLPVCPPPPAPEERIARLAEDYMTGLIKLITDRERHHQQVMDGLLDRIQDPSLPARKALREAADEVLDMDLRDVDDAWLKQPGSEMDFDPDLNPRFGVADYE